MTEWDVFPNAEAWAGWIIRSAALACGDRVYSSVPKNPEFPLVVVQRIGGIPVERHRLDSPNVQVDVWATTKTEAYTIAQEARQAIHAGEGGSYGDFDDCPVGIFVASVDDTLGLSFQPDPETSRDRYIFAVQLVTHVSAEDSS